MADDRGNEILMRLVNNDGHALAAETQTELNKDGDPLISDYENGKAFTVDDFSFGLNIDDQDPTSDTVDASGGNSAAAQVKFGKWKSATPAEIAKRKPFPVRMDEFTINRQFDRASPVLFQACARSTTFSKGSLVKRKVVGSGTLRTFLRIDFGQLLITHVSWDDAEVIRETLRFVFRSITIQYRRQAFDGTLSPSGSVTWKYNVNLRGQ